MPESVSLRAAVGDDVGFLFRVYAAARDTELAQVPWDTATKEAFLRQQFHAQDIYYREHFADADFLIIQSGNDPIGRLYVARRPDEIRIVEIALLPEFRGRRIGSSLLKGLLAEAQSSGRPVRIHVEKSNPALSLYRRLGFRMLEEGSVYLFMEWREAQIS